MCFQETDSSKVTNTRKPRSGKLDNFLCQAMELYEQLLDVMQTQIYLEVNYNFLSSDSATVSLLCFSFVSFLDDAPSLLSHAFGESITNLTLILLLSMPTSVRTWSHSSSARGCEQMLIIPL